MESILVLNGIYRHVACSIGKYGCNGYFCCHLHEYCLYELYNCWQL